MRPNIPAIILIFVILLSFSHKNVQAQQYIGANIVTSGDLNGVTFSYTSFVRGLDIAGLEFGDKLQASFYYRNLTENSTDLVVDLDTGLVYQRNLTTYDRGFAQELGYDLILSTPGKNRLYISAGAFFRPIYISEELLINVPIDDDTVLNDQEKTTGLIIDSGFIGAVGGQVALGSQFNFFAELQAERALRTETVRFPEPFLKLAVGIRINRPLAR
jgi:hypothetical protein